MIQYTCSASHLVVCHLSNHAPRFCRLTDLLSRPLRKMSSPAVKSALDFRYKTNNGITFVVTFGLAIKILNSLFDDVCLLLSRGTLMFVHVMPAKMFVAFHPCLTVDQNSNCGALYWINH